MRVRRRPRIVFCTAAAVAAASGLAAVDAAGAAPATPGQGGATSPRVCIEPTIRFGEAPDAPSVVTRAIPGGLRPGRYRVSATTSDGYPGRTDTAFDIETSERVTVYGHVTEDLADGVESDTRTLVFEVSFTEPQTEVEVSHTPANGPDSVRVDALCWERLGDVEISTSTTAAGGVTTTTTPGIVLQTVPNLIFLEGDPVTSTTAAPPTASAPPTTTTCASPAGSTTGGAGMATTCPASTVALGSQLPLAPTANAVTAAPAFTG
ncbi:MAG: hypothetical protein R2761_06565 [Acidimicrobiales bacterium]